MTEKVWFITGISRGLGKALAEAVLARGDAVIGTTRSGKADLPASEKLAVLKLDVTDRAGVFEAVAAAEQRYRRLDVVVNNAGYGLLGSVETTDPAEAADVMNANFTGTLNVCQAVLPVLRKQGTGHVINITSIAGIAPSPGSGIYAASKFAIEGFTASLALETKPLGLRVTCVEPGVFRTEFLADTSIRHTARQIEAYSETSGKVLGYLATIAGKQQGDPARAATAICRLVDSPNPPTRLLLVSDALKRTRAMLAQFAVDITAWEAVTSSTDFPAED